MITVQAIVNNNNEYNLSDYGVEGFTHLMNQGFGMAPVKRYTESGPLQQGSTDIGFRLQERIISFVFAINGEDEMDYYNKRRKLLNIFKPKFTNDPIKLRVTFPDGTVRQIDTHYVDGISFDSGDKSVWYHKVPVKLIAPDPTWYNPVGTTVPFNVSGTAGFTVPMSVPTSVGTSTLNTVQAVVYSGTWDTYPLITVFGPVTDLVITNVTTGDKLDFTGYTLNAGQILTIDTRYGYKTVRRENGSNQISQLTTDSDLVTFRLIAPEDDASFAVNNIQVTGTGINTATNIVLQYNERYIGL